MAAHNHVKQENVPNSTDNDFSRIQMSSVNYSQKTKENVHPGFEAIYAMQEIDIESKNDNCDFSLTTTASFDSTMNTKEHFKCDFEAREIKVEPIAKKEEGNESLKCDFEAHEIKLEPTAKTEENVDVSQMSRQEVDVADNFCINENVEKQEKPTDVRDQHQENQNKSVYSLTKKTLNIWFFRLKKKTQMRIRPN